MSTLALRRLLAVTAVCALVLVACGDSDDGADSASGGVTAADVWARATAEGQTNGAVYMDLVGGDEDDALVSASVSGDVATTAEVHETVMADDEMSDDEMSDDGEGAMDGAMTMREVDAVDVPAGETVSLAPGGYHIMLLDLAAPLEVGDELDVTLTFESGDELTVTAEVRES